MQLTATRNLQFLKRTSWTLPKSSSTLPPDSSSRRKSSNAVRTQNSPRTTSARSCSDARRPHTETAWTSVSSTSTCGPGRFTTTFPTFHSTTIPTPSAYSSEPGCTRSTRNAANPSSKTTKHYSPAPAKRLHSSLPRDSTLTSTKQISGETASR